MANHPNRSKVTPEERAALAEINAEAVADGQASGRRHTKRRIAHPALAEFAERERLLTALRAIAAYEQRGPVAAAQLIAIARAALENK